MSIGSDTYVVDATTDVVNETESGSDGVDLIQSSVTYTLPTNVENLTLTGTAAISGTGNELANIILGNGGANTLVGGDGADTLVGGSGNDSMLGGMEAIRMTSTTPLISSSNLEKRPI